MAAASTIILVMSGRTVRADFDGGSKPKLRAMREMKEHAEDLLSAVEVGLFIGAGVGKRVWVVTSDAWTNVLRLPTRATSGMNQSQLATALAFEAESLSSISAAQSVVAHRTLGDDQREGRYWVSQVAAAELGDLRAAVTRCGSKLMGVVHPAGLAAAGAGNKTTIELWPDTIVGRAGDDLEVVTADPRTMDWRVALGPWTRDRELNGAERWAASAAMVPADQAGDHWRVLDQESDLGAWLERCAAVLAHSTPRVPVLRPQAQPASSQQRATMVLAACAAVLAACLGHYLWFERERTDAQTVITQHEESRIKVAAVQKQVDDAKNRSDTIEQRVKQKRDLAMQRETTRRAHQVRWSRLLALVAEHAPRDLVIRAVSADGYDVTIAGACLKPELANELAAKLNEHLPDLGWRVQPPKKQALNGDSVAWSFELTLTDSAVPTPAVGTDPAQAKAVAQGETATTEGRTP